MSALKNILVLVYCFHPSRYAPARCGRFISSSKFPGLHVYEGKPMTVDEFHKLPADFLSTVDTGGKPVQVKLVEIEAKPKPEGNKKPDNETGDTDPDSGDDAPTETEPESESVEQAEATTGESTGKPTLEDIESLRKKGDVVELAAAHGLDLDPSLTRNEMEDRLVEFLNANGADETEK